VQKRDEKHTAADAKQCAEATGESTDAQHHDRE
jgi:hypothetical protein